MKNNRITRREFIGTAAATGVIAKTGRGQKRTEVSKSSKIDRFRLVNRHAPKIGGFDFLSPLSVGNGEFAFTCDPTGLQTFADEYKEKMPLCTMSNWGWHTEPRQPRLVGKELKLNEYDTRGRKVGYHTGSTDQKELFDWLRQNPHRLHLGRIGFVLKKSDGVEAKISDIKEIEQTLDLWKGIITSKFVFENKLVTVKTAVHPTLDLLAVSVDSDLMSSEKLFVRIAFPYGSPEMQAANWNAQDKHISKAVEKSNTRRDIQRRLDGDEYYCAVSWVSDARIEEEKAHHFLLKPAKVLQIFDFVTAFSLNKPAENLPTADEVFAASEKHWKNFWTTGGAIELIESEDARARELERRIVLSQYLTAINCSGSLPPQETGLTINSWYGKFHLEMHWWHAAQFALWNRLPLLEKSLDWYLKVLPSARDRARQQGYSGARWAKMTAPDGRDSPSPIGPLLIWQQPHPIFYAELCYLHRRDRATLRKYKQIVEESADFMASFAFYEAGKDRYVLGPPVIPAQENHNARETWNPTYELEYWRYGLKKANRWRERLGIKRNAKWDEIAGKLSALPVKDGVYIAHENAPQTFTERNIDHPSMLAAYGVLAGETVDRETMRRTLAKVFEVWKWEDTWGWDYPMTAMTAARLGEREKAIDALLLDTPKNGYAPNGHNYQRPNLPLYLPGNGGLLYAIALMTNGWKGAPQIHAPGFPGERWKVKIEGFNQAIFQEL